MCRIALLTVAALLAAPAHALLVDDFEAGPFSLVGFITDSQTLITRTPTQILGGERTVTVAPGVTADLVSTGSEDHVLIQFGLGW